MQFMILVAAAMAVGFSKASRLRPPAVPLAVRTPYLSAWLRHARQNPWEQWPEFWHGSVLGMTVLATIPQTGCIYPLLGKGYTDLQNTNESFTISFPTYEGVTFDASTTNLTFYVGSINVSDEPLKIVLSFMSPITPTSTMRQSLPASYLTVFVEGGFDVSIYVDITGEWATGGASTPIVWQFDDISSTGGNPKHLLKSFAIYRKEELQFHEIENRAEWGTVHFTAPADAKYGSGPAALLRREFSRTGALKNQLDKSFRDVNDNWPAFAFSKSFKLSSCALNQEIESCTDGLLLTLAHVQDRVAQYASARGLKLMEPLWASWFQNSSQMLQFHYFDFAAAKKFARAYSEQLALDSLKAASEDYADIVALSARQVLGATSFSGTPESPLLFLKEISSNGDFQTVDVIYPSFPFFLYTNPRWLAYLLEPLIEHQLSGQYPNNYSMHDLGVFPNATGSPDGNDEKMPVEECGNMLVMGLALLHAVGGDTAYDRTVTSDAISKSDDVSCFEIELDSSGQDILLSEVYHSRERAHRWLKRSYRLWEQWTGYLIREALIPANQLSTDDFAGKLANHTNLALKGIIGIRAMGEMADMMGHKAEAKNYRGISESQVSKWQEYATSRDGTHAKIAYGWYGSWTLLYNLYADAILCFHLPKADIKLVQASQAQQTIVKRSRTSFVNERVYKMQTRWYHDVLQKYGIPLDSRHLYTKSDWELFAIAVASKEVRDETLKSIASWVNETITESPLTDLYDTEGRGDHGINPSQPFQARPVVGGHFSLLALEKACGGKALAGLKFLDDDDDDDDSMYQ